MAGAADTEVPMPASAMRGSYGDVTVGGDSAFKRLPMFDRSKIVMPNLNEAAFAAALMRAGVDEIVRIKAVTCGSEASRADSCFVVEMERGQCSLHEWMQAVPFARRMEVLPQLLSQLTRQLVVLHAHGLVHGDLKTSNVVVVDGRADSFRALIVDFGSAHLYRRAPDVATELCTWTFAPPETFEGVPDTPLTDAYSLGAVLHTVVFKRFPDPCYSHGDTHKSIRARHRSGAIAGSVANTALPPGVPEHEYRTMLRLLAPDPRARLSVAALAGTAVSDGARSYAKGPGAIGAYVLDPVGPRDVAWGPGASWGARASAVARIFRHCARVPRCAPLACNILDRYVDAKGGEPTDAEVHACESIARCLLAHQCPSVGDAGEERGWDAVMRVMRVLSCEVYSETCDCLVAERLPPGTQLDQDRLRWAITESHDGSALAAAELYLDDALSTHVERRRRLRARRAPCRAPRGQETEKAREYIVISD